MKALLLPLFVLCVHFSTAQSVGIGTTSPNAKAVLEVKATDKGILFPRLTTAQRNAIADPPNGLQIFNTDERCLNYYDSVYAFWNCYCYGCETIIINITANACKIDFYNSYGRFNPAKRYLITIAAGVTISGCAFGDTALSFSNLPGDAIITINNYGTIAGAGGKGGNGAKTLVSPFGFSCVTQASLAVSGQAGGAAISTKSGVMITVNNYGVIAGGGGGGAGGGAGGGSSTTTDPGGGGGGGGGGAGTVAGSGGIAGGSITGNSCTYSSMGTTAGQSGTATAGGTGGSGGSTTNPGAAGGNRGQAGASTATGTSGGAAGRAIAGGMGNAIVNYGGGQVFGTAD